MDMGYSCFSVLSFGHGTDDNPSPLNFLFVRKLFCWIFFSKIHNLELKIVHIKKFLVEIETNMFGVGNLWLSIGNCKIFAFFLYSNNYILHNVYISEKFFC